MGLEVLFGHLLPKLQWDSSGHLLPSADQQAQLDMSAYLCQVLSSSPSRQLCPAAPTPQGLQPGKGAVAPKPAPEGTNQGLACGQAPWSLEMMAPFEGSDCGLCAPWRCERGYHPVTELCRDVTSGQG